MDICDLSSVLCICCTNNSLYFLAIVPISKSKHKDTRPKSKNYLLCYDYIKYKETSFFDFVVSPADGFGAAAAILCSGSDRVSTSSLGSEEPSPTVSAKI